MNTANITQVSASGDVTTTDTLLRAVVLTAGSDAATATVNAGGSGGTTVLTVKAAASETVTVTGLNDAYCSGGVHVALTGTGPTASLVYA